MRLLLINYEYPPLGGGAGTATAALVREFAGLGAQVLVLTSAFGDLPRREQQGAVTIVRIPVVRRCADRSSVFEMITFMLSAAVSVLRETRAWRPDATLAFFGIPGGPVALWLKWVRGVPYVVSLRGGDVPGHQAAQLSRHHRITRPLIRFVWRHAAAVVANSAGLRREALLTAPALTIHSIPNGVDADRFQPLPPPVQAPSPGPVQLLFVGRASAEKGLLCLLDALARLKDLPWAINIVGDGPELAAIRAEAVRQGLADRLTCSGWLPRADLPERYRQADLFVFPSTDEGMPNTVLEAMASELPVVACRIAGCEELVDDQTTGLLVPPRDPAALAQAIAQLVNDPVLRARFGQAARQRVERRFSWRAAAEAYLALMRK